MIPKLKKYWQLFLDYLLKFSILVSFISILPLLVATLYYLVRRDFLEATLISVITFLLIKINKEMRD
jgi:hypothetical protein